MARLDPPDPARREPREVQFVTFEVDGDLYGLDIHVVKEINPSVPLMPVARAPVSIRGLVNIRGQVVLVLDLAVILGRQSRPSSSQVVILKTAAELRNGRFPDSFDPRPFGEKPLALLVEQLGDVLTFPQQRVAPPPAHVSEANARYIEGVVELDDRLLVILDPCTLLMHDPAS